MTKKDGVCVVGNWSPCQEYFCTLIILILIFLQSLVVSTNTGLYKKYANYYLVFQKCFSIALRKRLSCTDSRASISRCTCHMSMMFSFSERTSITLSPTARVWILNKFPHIFFGREKKFCQIFRVVKNDVKYALKFDKKNTFSSFWWLVAEYTHYMVMLSISFDSLDVFTS